MKVYALDFGRPIGMEPKFYYKKPQVDPPITPWCPVVREFENEFEARKYYKTYYPSLYKKLEVIK